MMFPLIRTNGRNLFAAMDPWAQLNYGVDQLLGQPARTFAVDVREEGNDLVLQADLPGVAQSDLEVTVENGELTIGVNRKTETEQTEGGYYVRERHTGNLTRTFRLPDTADLNQVGAELTNGVLTLRIPKREEAKPRQIPIK